MEGFCQWLLLSTGLFLYFLIHPACTLSLDILLKVYTNSECLQPVVCKQDFIHQSVSWSFILSPSDLFALGKSVKTITGDVILTTSVSTTSQLNNVHRENILNMDFDMCSVNCSVLFVEQNFRHVFIQSVHDIARTTRHSIFESVINTNSYIGAIVKDISSLLSKTEWKTYIIFTSLYEELTLLSPSNQSSTASLLLFTMDEKTHLNGTLQSIYSLLGSNDLNFIIVCSARCIVTVVNQAYQLETTVDKTSKWLLVPTEGDAKEIGNTPKQVPDSDIVIMDFVQDSKRTSLRMNSVQDHLSSIERDNSKNNQGLFVDYLEKTLAGYDPSKSAIVYSLYTSQREKEIRRVGHITQDGDTTITEELFPGFKYGLNNRTLTVSTLEWPLFVIKREENGSATYTGLCIDLLKELSRSLNFSYKIVEPEDQEWGRVLNGKWTGLIGDLAHKKVDLVVAPMSMTEDRVRVMDFTTPFFYEKSGFLLKKPDLNANKWMTLVAPFRYEVHICILISLILSTVFLFITEEAHPVNTWTDNRLSARRIRCGDILWYHFGALMANGGAYLPTSQSGRSVLSCWWLFTVISAAIYSGNLIAFLTDWREKPPFSTLAQMVEQDTYKWGTIGGGYYTTIFQNSSRPVYQKVWQGIQSDPEVNSLDPEVHKRKVLAGQYAFLADVTIIEKWRSESCDLHLLYEQFIVLNYAIGLPNNSAYTSLFTNEVLRIIEMGLPDVWSKQWTSLPPCGTSAKSAKRVDLLALQSAFYAAGVGVLLALCVLLTEVLYSRKCRHCEASTSRITK